MVPDPFIPGAVVRESLADVYPSDRMAHAVHEQLTSPEDPERRAADRDAYAADVAASMKETIHS